MRFDKNRIILIAVVAVLGFILAVLVIVALGDMVDRKVPQTQSTTAPTQPQAGADVTVPTPYGELTFPGQWADYLQVERIEKPELKLEFIAQTPSGKIQKLFSIRFGEPSEPAVGQLLSPQGLPVGVYVTKYTFSPDGTWPLRESTAVSEMLQAVDQVVASLNLRPLGTPLPDADGEALEIETLYVNLYFPARWQEELRTTMSNTDGYEVTFSAVINGHNPIKLFALNFGGSESAGEVVHTLIDENDVAFYVRLRTFPLETEGLSSLDQATVMAMQEDLNYLLSRLFEE